MTPQPPPTEDLKKLSLDGSSQMPVLTRSGQTASSDLVVSERTGITYDIRGLPQSVQRIFKEGLEYAKKAGVGNTRNDSAGGSYTFGLAPEARPDGVVRIYRAEEDKPKIGCIPCLNSKSQLLCVVSGLAELISKLANVNQHVIWFLDHLLSWFSLRLRPLDPVRFNEDGTFEGRPLPFDMVNQGGFDGCLQYLKAHACKDSEALPKNRVHELEDVLELFQPRPFPDEDVGMASDLSSDGGLFRNLYDRFSALIVSHAEQNPKFFRELEDIFQPQSHAALLFERSAREAVQAIVDVNLEGLTEQERTLAIDEAIEEVTDNIRNIQFEYERRNSDNDELAGSAVRAILFIIEAAAKDADDVVDGLLRNPQPLVLHAALEMLESFPSGGRALEQENLGKVTKLLREASVPAEYLERWERLTPQSATKRKVEEQGGSSFKKGKASR